MRTIEYEFILPNGERRYEFVDPDADMPVMMQVELFLHMHKAIIARPVEPEDPA